MGKKTGFIEFSREDPKKRPVDERIKDWDIVFNPLKKSTLRTQGARCMDCGIPFCHQGCPLGNLIPEWNDLVYNDQWKKAYLSLDETNNFPEFTGYLCPAPCEDACVLTINDNPVTIKEIEKAIIENAFKEGWVETRPQIQRTEKKVAVIGSGPAGLAAAQQLNRAGHTVTVYERDDRLGGLIRYGIPDYKMDKGHIDRRIAILEKEGIAFITSCNIGVDVKGRELLNEFDAIILACGALKQRSLQIPGHDLKGVYFAMEYLTQQNRLNAGDDLALISLISAKNKHVVIIGGGDTGADCLGTATRQGAKSITQLQYHPLPPLKRDQLNNPWPQVAHVFHTSFVNEEGGERRFSVMAKNFIGDGEMITGLNIVQVNKLTTPDGGYFFEEIPNTEEVIDADLVLNATGFEGPDCFELIKQLQIKTNEKGCVAVDENWSSNIKGVFSAGDMMRGASLIVWAIADGRQCARSVDQYLMGDSDL